MTAPARHERTERVRELALAEGFDAVGVARLAPAASGAALRRWLARGDQAGMAWLGRRVERRLDPRESLPGARSALVVAWRYAPVAEGGEAGPLGDLWRGVARYARGADYHDFLLERLQRAGQRIAEELPEMDFRAYVDTGPLLERELAVRSGLGAIGKNTNLLSPTLGSWLLLGVLLLTLDLEPDPPIGDLCGECARCLEACPTGALPEPFRLDANRCISYWTIEHRGPIPAELRVGIGEWAFGCDVCQEVCPWNGRPAPLAGREELRPPVAGRALDLVALLELPDQELRRRLTGSPLLRPKPAGLRRNAALVLGNAGRAEALPALVRALGDPSPVVRGQAAWSLGRLGGSQAREALEAAGAVEEDDGVLGEIARALAALD